MKIVLAPDSFKDCMSACTACDAMAAGVRRVYPEADLEIVPMADGGQGTVAALVLATGGETLTCSARDPLGRPIEAQFGLIHDGKTAVIEMAAASGLERLQPAERQPLLTSTAGTGDLVKAALELGVEEILLGVGGSATNDGGAGLAQALGYQLLDETGAALPPGGGALQRLSRIDASQVLPALLRVPLRVICDVTNPLTGVQGAAAVYGPQKGATPEMVAQLDANLVHLAAIVRRDLQVEMEHIAGAGAAGGLAGGLIAFCHAQLQRGVELVLSMVRLRERLVGADLCLTGEGALDYSSQFGKTALGVAQLAQELGVPTVAFAGAVRPEARTLLDLGLTAYFDITPHPCTLPEALQNGPSWLTNATEQVIRLFFRTPVQPRQQP